MKKLKLKQKLILLPLITVLIVYLFSFGYVIMSLQKKNTHDAEQIVANNLQLNAKKLEKLLDTKLATVKGIATVFETYRYAEEKSKVKLISEVENSLVVQNEDFKVVWSSWQLEHFSNEWGNKSGRMSITYMKTAENTISIVRDSMDIDGIETKTGYHSVMKSKRETIMEPYFDKTFGIYETTLAVPVMYGEDFAGLVGIDIDVAGISKLVEGLELFEGSYSFLISNKGQYVYYPDTAIIGQTFNQVNHYEDSLYNITDKIGRGEPFKMYATHTDNYEQILLQLQPIYIGNTQTPWCLGVVVYMNKIKAETNGIIRNIIISNVIGILIISIVLFLITRNIFTSFDKGIVFAQKISKGDLTATLDVEGNDEVGMLASSLKEMANRLRKIIDEIKSSSVLVEDFGKKLNNRTHLFNELAENQKNTSQEVFFSVSEIAEHLRISTSNAAVTRDISEAASENLVIGSEFANQTNAAMRDIAKYIDSITKIASKTDLLAINAAIEAARAGESGKGFAVVALEVRKLAENTQKAANEIVNLSNQGVSISQETGNMISSLVPEMKKTAELVKEISELSINQTLNVQEIKETISKLNILADNNSDYVKELSKNAEEFMDLSYNLKKIVGFFKT